MDFSSMNLWVENLAMNHSYIIYLVLIFLGFAEGPFLSLFCGVLLNLGYISLLPVYLSLMLGDLLGDAFWYYLGNTFGYKFVNKFGKYFDITEEKIHKMSAFFHRHKHKILFISKSTNGFGFSLATLFTAGMVKIPFWRYMYVNGLGQFVWTGFLMSVGYYFGNIFISVNSIFSKISTVILFVLFFFAFLQFRKYLQKRVNQI